ncbi:MAG: hypothetical protein KBT20_01960 [Bacteroidales bacterium]|nr:hypothetical protein [Candidatus Liminaster caballi]
MKNRITILLLSLLAMVMCLPTEARADFAKAEIDTPWVYIGIPRMLHVEISVPEGAEVSWPTSITPRGIAAVDYEDSQKRYMLEYGPDARLNIDTLRKDGMVTYSQDIQVFAFDSAAMLIEPFKFVVNGRDTVSTQVVALKVEHPFESVSDDPSSIQGLKSLLVPGFVIWDYAWWMLWVLIVVLVGFAAFYGYQYYKTHRTGEKPVEEVKVPLEPAHVVALRALTELNGRKLWQEGKHKQFHTELTDILRQYIERRYNVQAMEKTTDEILDELVELTISQRSSHNNLKEVLQMADLVKFAKYEPLPDENQLVYMNSRLFVEQTKESLPTVSEDAEVKTSTGGYNKNER